MPDVLPFETTPRDVKKRLDDGESILLVDVREPHESAVARIEGADLIPMRTVPARIAKLEELAEGATLVVYCHHGVRSASVVDYLRKQGIDGVQSMAGGIDRWSVEVDSSIP